MAAAGQDKTLRDVAIGETSLVGEGALKRHIMDMGITKGVEVSFAGGAARRSASRSPFAAMSYAQERSRACSFFSSSRPS